MPNIMEYKCVIIDDEPIAIEVLQNHLAKLENVKVAASFTKPLEAMQYLAENPVDLLFLDIEMPAITGFGLLKTLTIKPKVIITTAHRNYAAEAFDFQVLDYLLKPFPFERFLKAMNRFYNSVSQRSPNEINKNGEQDYMIVKADKRFHKVFFDQILFIESMDDFIRIHTPDTRLDVYDRLVGMETKLPAGRFLRVHLSYLVNRSKIDSFSSSEIFIGKNEIPIGKSYRENIIAILSEP
jgi:DNA-binding LytR/AlgR family response regulator